MTIPPETRERVAAVLRDASLTLHQVAQECGVSYESVYRINAEFRHRGFEQPTGRERQRARVMALAARVAAMLPDPYADSGFPRVAAELGISASYAAKLVKRWRAANPQSDTSGSPVSSEVVTPSLAATQDRLGG